jgi:hypothetical protein
MLTIKRIYDRCAEEGECRIWQQSVQSQGYPQISADGHGPRLVTHLVLELSGRPRPSKRHHATTRCGNRLCVSEHCLRWWLPGQILRKAYSDGARSTLPGYLNRLEAARALGWAKLTWEQVDKARERMAAGESAAAVGRDYGVKAGAMRALRRGDAWRRTTALPSRAAGG